jgi:hypothetical protein
MALVKSRPMLTLNSLCAEMKTSDRYLSRRAARDWWTKGLLPRPRRHGLGRGRGTETFWTDSRIAQQAQAAYDLLAAYPRTEIALLSLWLLGFSVRLDSIRAIYRKLINRHLRAVHGRLGQQPDDVIWKFADTLARQTAKTSAAPVEARRSIAQLAFDFLEVFYGLDGGVVTEGLAELWEKAAPYMGGGASQTAGLADLHPRDEDLAAWAHYVKAMASLGAQQKTIKSASNYELMRARRLVLFVSGYLRRVARAAECPEGFEEFGRRLLIVLGRSAVPILIAVLRNDAFRKKIMSSLLDLVRKLPRRAEWPAQWLATRYLLRDNPVAITQVGARSSAATWR